MVFMGNGRAEQGKDAIARVLDHVAFIAMDRIHHELDGWIDNGARLFGIEVFHEVHRAFDVGKKGSYGFAFAVRGGTRFPCCLLGPNALGKVRGRVANGGLGSRRVRGPKSGVRSLRGNRTRCEGGATLSTKLKAERIVKPTPRTAVLEGRATLATEFHAFRIVQPTARTLHASCSLFVASGLSSRSLVQRRRPRRLAIPGSHACSRVRRALAVDLPEKGYCSKVAIGLADQREGSDLDVTKHEIQPADIKVTVRRAALIQGNGERQILRRKGSARLSYWGKDRCPFS